jgi:Double-GTPase 2
LPHKFIANVSFLNRYEEDEMTEVSCSQPGCPVGVSGRCLEGFDPASTCPYQTQQDIQSDEVATYGAQDFITLPSGEALTQGQAAEVAREDICKVIIIAGPLNSGKTTILTSLYEAFQEAPFSNFLFRGSRTLFGFERRSHLGRKESGAEEPDTTHTSLREGVVFLHLALSVMEEEKLRHSSLLLSDVSGELFRRLRDSSEAAKEFSALRRADHLCIVIDGAKISSPEERHVASNDSRSMLRSIIESGNFAPNSVIDIVFTKWDIVVEAMQFSEREVRDFINATKSSLVAISSRFEIRFHEIAARPSLNAKVPFAHGLPTLLRSWMSNARQLRDRAIVYSPKQTRREFDRFTTAIIARRHLENVYDVRRS